MVFTYQNSIFLFSLKTAMGTLISALTGSDDPKEVAVMAKQAVDVSSTLNR